MTLVGNYLLFVCHIFYELGQHLPFFIHLENIYLLHYYRGLCRGLRRICRGFEIDVAPNFNIRIEIPSQPWALFGSNERLSLRIISGSILISESLVTVSMVWLLGRELPFLIGLHCYLKKSFNRFALSKKSVKNPFFIRRGGINGIFEPLANVFKIDQ